ncbi:MAG: hypothetical protein PHT51_00820 [Patescibacteria group bacterium]|nr:hypothetical protein [Patescibacteria group bacterium]MDD4610595.1 hypothetical protein [Patescibacteria group bacterium]
MIGQILRQIFSPRRLPDVKVTYYVRPVKYEFPEEPQDVHEAVMTFPCGAFSIVATGKKEDLVSAKCPTKFGWVRAAMEEIGCSTCKRETCRVRREVQG